MLIILPLKELTARAIGARLHLLLVARVQGKVLSKVKNRTSEVIVPHHPVQGADVVGGGPGVHPVGVDKLHCCQTNWFHSSIDFLNRLVIVIFSQCYLETKYYYLSISCLLSQENISNKSNYLAEDHCYRKKYLLYFRLSYFYKRI